MKNVDPIVVAIGNGKSVTVYQIGSTFGTRFQRFMDHATYRCVNGMVWEHLSYG